MDQQLDHELAMYKRMASTSVEHPGRACVRELLDSLMLLDQMVPIDA